MFNLDSLYNGWTSRIRTNVICYYNAVIPLSEHTEIIATTLWSHIERQDAFRTELAISDFRRIKCGDNDSLNWTRFNMEHDKCFRFLKESIFKSNKEHIIVVTHHVPSLELLAPKFTGSLLNGAFTVDLTDYITNNPIEVIHIVILIKLSAGQNVSQTNSAMYSIMNIWPSTQTNS